MEIKLLIFIPTRNRADLAKNAIRSALIQGGCEFEIVISDNSTDEAEASKLRAFCDEIADDRLTYIRPEYPLPMTKHWEWAMRKMLENYSFTHFTILTDRMVFKKNALTSVSEIVKDFPSKLVSYCMDEILDDPKPWVVSLRGTTGRLFEVKNEVLISAFLQLVWIAAFPTVMNSWVPREIIEKIAANYSEIFSSISPDFSFGFKVIDQEDSILYYDQAMVVSYSYTNSNGRSFLTGNRDSNKDAKDFDENIASEDIHVDSILPFCSTIVDAVLNEYFYILKNSKRRNFPPVNQNRYKGVVLANVLALQNIELRSRLLEILREKFGLRYYEYYLRGRYPVRRYTRRLLEEIMLTILRKEGIISYKEIGDLDGALEYAMNTSGKKLKTLINFYKRTSIWPSKVHALTFGDA